MTQEPAYLGQTAGLAQGIAEARNADANKPGWGGLFGGLVGLGSQFLPKPSMPTNPFGGQVADVSWSGYGQ